ALTCSASPAALTRGPPALPSFPTRRSSDLAVRSEPRDRPHHYRRGLGGELHHAGCNVGGYAADVPPDVCQARLPAAAHRRVLLRSEEHTSELQSRENLVCRLLLEKKKDEAH